MRCKNIFALAFILFFIGIVSASFSVSESGKTVKTAYQQGGYLEATVNISFTNQLLSSNFTDSEGNTVQLKSILDQNAAYIYAFGNSSNTSVSSSFQLLNLGGTNFQMQNEGNFNYILKLGGENIFQSSFSVSSEENDLYALFNEKYNELNRTKVSLENYSQEIQALLINLTNLDYFENQLIETEKRVENYVPDEYQEILDNLTAVNLPLSIIQTVSMAPIVFYPNRDSINLEILAYLSGEEEFTGNEAAYKDAIFLWNSENLNTKVAYNKFLISYSEEQTSKYIYTFDFLNPANAFFILQDIGDVVFLEDNFNRANEYYIVEIVDGYPNKIVFASEVQMDLDIPAFISPSLNELQLQEIEEPERWTETKKWLLFGLLVFILILIGIISYVLIQIWYRQRYESYLFKTKNNMYNIMVYIQNAKRRGMPKEEIVKNLRKTGWTREQIEYAVRKYEGKKIAGLIHNPDNLGSEDKKDNIIKK